MFLKWVQGSDVIFFQRELMYFLHRKINNVAATVIYVFLK